MADKKRKAGAGLVITASILVSIAAISTTYALVAKDAKQVLEKAQTDANNKLVEVNNAKNEFDQAIQALNDEKTRLENNNENDKYKQIISHLTNKINELNQSVADAQ
ncbi:hypothetical protein [Mycoplasmopsis adleri]|uniref:hypothetical protein n=1 Tax=Mycoplasmopsis adleri TaxID=51362 RepID=UPI0038739359